MLYSAKVGSVTLHSEDLKDLLKSCVAIHDAMEQEFSVVDDASGVVLLYSEEDTTDQLLRLRSLTRQVVAINATFVAILLEAIAQMGCGRLEAAECRRAKRAILRCADEVDGFIGTWDAEAILNDLLGSI